MNPAAHAVAAAPLPNRWPTGAFVRVDVAALMRGEPLPPGVRHRSAWRQACGEVARDPLNLDAHARRVLLACMAGERAPVFDALVDVFLALGPRALALRQALVERAQPWLDDESHDFLVRHLPGGLTRDDPLPTHGAALLDPGLIGLPVVVRHLQPLPFDPDTIDAVLVESPVSP